MDEISNSLREELGKLGWATPPSRLRRLLEEACDWIDRLVNQLASLRAIHDARAQDAHVAHMWFAEQFGEEMNGRDFATKVSMANEIISMNQDDVAESELQAWADIRVQMLDSTDYKTARHVFDVLEGLNVSLKAKGRPSFDARILEVGATGGDLAGGVESDITGMVIQPTIDGEVDDNCPEELIPYEDIEIIGVY